MSLTAHVPVAHAPELEDAWHPCQLEEHLVERRTHHKLVSGFVDNLVPPAARRVLRIYCASVGELVEHLEGLHDDECLVRAANEGR